MDISPERARLALSALAFPNPAVAEPALRLAHLVVAKRKRWAWSVGSPTVTAPVPPSDPSFLGAVRCDCRPLRPRDCAHIAAVLLVAGHEDPAFARFFQAALAAGGGPLFSTAGPSSPPEIAAGAATTEAQAAGVAAAGIYYDVDLRALSEAVLRGDGPQGLEAVRRVARLGTREWDLRSLGSLPTGLGADAGDERIADALASLRTGTGSVGVAAQRLMELVADLVATGRLESRGRRLQRQEGTSPLRWSLRAIDGGVEVHAAGAPRAVLWGNPAWVLCGDRDLWVAPRGSSRDGLLALSAAPKVLTWEALSDWLESQIAAVPMPVEWDGRVLDAEEADFVEPFILAREVGDGLRLECRGAFRRGDLRRSRPRGDSLGTFVIPGPAGGCPRLLRRDRQREDEAARLASQILGPRGLGTLKGEALLNYLADDAPRITEQALTEGFDAAISSRMAGSIEPRLRWESADNAESGETTLPTLRFVLGSLDIPAARVRRGFDEGRGWIPIDGQRLARLPTAWLQRHLDSVDTLDRLAAGGQIPLFAAPLLRRLAESTGEAAPEAVRREDERVRAVGGVPDRPAPAGLLATLRPYQHEGFRWMSFLADLGAGACLADDMGLGKTVQVLAAVLERKSLGPARTLLVAPTSVLDHWRTEAQRFAPSLRVAVHHGPRRPDKLPDDADLVVTSYALLRQDEALLTGQTFDVAIFDEAQFLKNSESLTARIARRIPARWRVAVTGTPLENALTELWSLFDLVLPGILGPRARFEARFGTGRIDDGALADLRATIRPFMLRRKRAEVLGDLPPVSIITEHVELGPAQWDLYDRTRRALREPLFKRIDEEGFSRSSLHVLEALLRLRQAACEPRLLPFEEAQVVCESAKREEAVRLLVQAASEGHRTLVFSQWPTWLRFIATDLEAAGLPFLYLDGQTTDRGALVEAWNRGDGPPVFLLSLRAGGAGLHLAAADHVVLLDPWWNPAVEAQAIGRAHRMGQQRPVTVWRLVAAKTVEARILDVQARKRDLFEGVVEEDRLVVDQLDEREIRAIFDED